MRESDGSRGRRTDVPPQEEARGRAHAMDRGQDAGDAGGQAEAGGGDREPEPAPAVAQQRWGAGEDDQPDEHPWVAAALGDAA